MNKEKLDKINSLVRELNGINGYIKEKELAKFGYSAFRFSNLESDIDPILKKYEKRAIEDILELLNKKRNDIISELKELGYEVEND
jgi:phosphoribosyl-ATP pyrophosphohydrolase